MAVGWSLPSHIQAITKQQQPAPSKFGPLSHHHEHQQHRYIYDRQHGIHPRSDNLGSATTIQDAFEDLMLLTKLIGRNDGDTTILSV
jgi:hypothetical protein